jgi:hypothetical protein
MSRGSQSFYQQPLDYFSHEVVRGWGLWNDGFVIQHDNVNEGRFILIGFAFEMNSRATWYAAALI